MQLRTFLSLTRFPVSLAVTITGLAAAILYKGPRVTWELVWPILGIFLLASGASALNQYQEWQYDEKMDRTRNRPIPSRKITTGQALNNATLLIISGYILFIITGAWLPLVLGVFNVFWYNGVYTLLKRRTAFAGVPGALTGAIPVFMGWTAAGGGLFDHPALFLAIFIFLWQMPHFWLIMLKYGDEYKNAGFPSMTDLLTATQLKRVIFAWIIASSFAAVMLVYFGLIRMEIFRYILLGVHSLLLILIFYGLFIAKEISYRMLFIAGNALMLFVFILLILDRLLF